MRRLAYNDKAILIKTDGKEYWVVDCTSKELTCYNSQEKDYNAINALETFEKSHGSATWKREGIERW